VSEKAIGFTFLASFLIPGQISSDSGVFRLRLRIRGKSGRGLACRLRNWGPCWKKSRLKSVWPRCCLHWKSVLN